MAWVARSLDEPRLQGMLAGLRHRFGTATIERASDGAARQILGTLRRGGVLGMLIDQDTKVDGVWVPFFGRPAFTPAGAAKIALRQGTGVIPTFIERRPDGSHLIRVQKALALPEDPREATAVMTLAIEGAGAAAPRAVGLDAPALAAAAGPLRFLEEKYTFSAM